MKKYALRVLFAFLVAFSANALAEIPFVYNSDDLMLVHAEVNGVTGYYIIDTGAPNIIVFGETQNLTTADESDYSYWLLGITFLSKRYNISKVNLDGVSLTGDFQIIKAPDTVAAMFNPAIKGIMNICALYTGSIEISFSQRKIRLLEKVPDGYTKNFSYITEYTIPFLPLTVNSTEYLFRIDTGNTKMLLFPEVLLNTIETKNIYQVATNALYSSEPNKYSYYIFKIGNFTLFDHVYNNVICETNTLSDRAGRGGIGIQLLKNYDIVFDTGTQKLWLKPLMPDILYNVFFGNEIRAFGLLDYGYMEDSIVASSILVDSPAWKKGLRPGNKITKINSYNTAGLSQGHLQRTLQSNDFVKIEFYDDTGKKKTVWAKPKVLIK